MEEMEVERRRGGQYLPLEQRIRLHDKVIWLHKQGLNYKQIIQRIHRYNGVRLTYSHISYWVRGIKAPLGKVNKFDRKRPVELAGVIGVILSDGNISLHGRGMYEMQVRVKDREYAEAFGHDLAKVLRKRKPYKPHWRRSEQHWFVRGRSILLFKHLDRPWQKLRSDIEVNKTCVVRFLKRFFDGEASIEERRLKVHNTNKELLLYIQSLLRRYFSIEGTGPHRSKKAGYCFRDYRYNKVYKTEKTCYYLYIPAEYLQKFHRHIGFTIKRKQRKLIEAIRK